MIIQLKNIALSDIRTVYVLLYNYTFCFFPLFLSQKKGEKNNSVQSPPKAVPVTKSIVIIRELEQLRLQKNNRFNDQNNSSARASRFSVHFFDLHCTLRRETS